MVSKYPLFRAQTGRILLATGIMLSLNPIAIGALPLNTVNDGRIVKDGTYYNTATGKTTFINNGSGGLWIKSNSTVRSLEVDAAGNLTKNGGTLQFYAPGNVVRIDGNIDANAVRNGQGVSLGNGGKVFIDSDYLFQNGNIFANGRNGGLVQANVAGMTLGPSAKIEAIGFGGQGGVVAINASSSVDLRRGSVIDTSGRISSGFDTNLINIEGSLVNVEGVLRANGVASNFGGSHGGTIRLVATGQSNQAFMENALIAAGERKSSDTELPTLSSAERQVLMGRINTLVTSHEGDIALTKDTNSTSGPVVSANATYGLMDPNNDYIEDSHPRAGDGGSIQMTSVRDVVNQGLIQANGAIGQHGVNPIAGGNGGSITMLSLRNIQNLRGRIEANGGRGGRAQGINSQKGANSGDGGLLAFSYNDSMTNSGNLYADGAKGGDGPQAGRGGNGGLVVFSGNTNPTGNGSIDTLGRAGGNEGSPLLGGKPGTIVSPQPSRLGQTQVYFQQGYDNGQAIRTHATEQTRFNELLTHGENLIFLMRTNATEPTPGGEPGFYFLEERLSKALIRSVQDPLGNLGLAMNAVKSKTQANSSYPYRNFILSNHADQIHIFFVSGQENINFGSFSGSLGRLNTWTVSNDNTFDGVSAWFAGSHDNFGGGHISILAKDGTVDPGGGGTSSLGYGLGTLGKVSGGSVNLASQAGVRIFDFMFTRPTDLAHGGLHGGSQIAKSPNVTYIGGGASGGALNDLNGPLMGGSLYMQALQEVGNWGPVQANATSNSSDTGTQGGIVTFVARDVFRNGNSDIHAPIEANATAGTKGYGGYIRVQAGTIVKSWPIEAKGSLQDGKTILTETPASL